MQCCAVDRKLHEAQAILSTSPISKSEEVSLSVSAHFSVPVLQLGTPAHSAEDYHLRDRQLT